MIWHSESATLKCHYCNRTKSFPDECPKCGSDALKKPSVLSGGEKARCMFSMMMLSQANVLLLDGPTNHLDLESITAINEAMKKFKGAIIFTSHDHELIQTVANRIIEIDEVIKYDNNVSYEDYLSSLAL